MELQQYLRILKDRWIAGFATAILVLAAVTGFTLVQTPTYEATNRVFVQTDAGSTVADLSSGVNFASQQITSYADLATTPLVLQPVVDELGLAISPSELASRISTSVPSETLILEITASAEDPALAAAIANATAESLQAQVTDLEAPGEEGASNVELTVISPAFEPKTPASPDLLLNVAIGVTLAILAGVVVALFRDLLDNRIRRAEAVEKTFGRSVIAAIPASRDTRNLPLVATQHPQSIQAEAYRDLRTNLQFMTLEEEKRSVLVTSSIPGEGKTSSAINLAHVLAQTGGRVLLIDADLRRPSIADYLGLEASAGLTTVLIGEVDLEDVIYPLETEGLEVLTSGMIPPNPSELLGSTRMEQLLSAATATYDYLVVDTSPLLAVTDAAVLSSLVGGTVVVAQSDRVTKQQLGQSLEKLDAVGARLLGVVLNRVHKGKRQNYYYSYDSATDAPAEASSVAKASKNITPAPATPNPSEIQGEDGLTVHGIRAASGRRSIGRRAKYRSTDNPDTTPRLWPGASRKPPTL